MLCCALLWLYIDWFSHIISIRLTSLALWQSNDCPSASKATLMNMDKYFMWIHYERLHNHNKAKHNNSCAYFLGYTVQCGGEWPKQAYLVKKLDKVVHLILRRRSAHFIYDSFPFNWQYNPSWSDSIAGFFISITRTTPSVVGGVRVDYEVFVLLLK